MDAIKDLIYIMKCIKWEVITSLPFWSHPFSQAWKQVYVFRIFQFYYQCLGFHVHDPERHTRGTLVTLSMAHIALTYLALLPHSLCLAKKHDIIVLKLATRVHSIIWPYPPPEAYYQGPVIKILKYSNQKPSLAHLINTSNKIKHGILTQFFPF